MTVSRFGIGRTATITRRRREVTTDGAFGVGPVPEPPFHLRPGGGLVAQFPAPLNAPLRGAQGIAASAASKGRGELRDQLGTARRRTRIPRRV
ncbi:hypothetical protein GCM10010278_13950 [Streptomyces melanogenes]|nr:hypothetical protein GCM10010278_13950 [Streptomyces melanogenes]